MTPAEPARGPNTQRLAFLDWTRGLAITIILQGHVFHSFSRNDLRNDGPFVISQFFGGLAPALFLVLTGITLAFIMDRNQQKGLTPGRRWLAALRRGGYLWTLAFLFRIQLWAFAFGQSSWRNLLKVDVLNCMGLTIVLLSVLTLPATRERVRLGALIGLVIALLSPMVSAGDWKWLPAPVSDYFVPSFDYFPIFPWGAFIAFGVSIGSILRLTKPGDLSAAMQWSALAGFGAVIGGMYFANLPYTIYPKADFWLDGPLLVVIKTGLVLIILAAAYAWNRYYVGEGWSWFRQLGTTSLIVYWVHIEIVYGRWFGKYKESLSTPHLVGASIVLMFAMLALSIARTSWNRRRAVTAMAEPRLN